MTVKDLSRLAAYTVARRIPLPRTAFVRGTPVGCVLAPGKLWLNGDGRFRAAAIATASVVHDSEEQAMVVVVPYAALEAASVDYRTIDPVEVHSEHWERTERISKEPPADMRPVPTVSVVVNGEETFARHPDTTLIGQVTRWGTVSNVRRISDGRYYWQEFRHWLGDSVFTAERRGKREHFISSWDHQETPPLYFLSQLPGPATSLDEALELLAPDSVKTARDLGKNIVRQGDIFAVETDISARELAELGATIKKRRVWWEECQAGRRVVDATPLFGTAHTATEVATMPDGTQYARGMLYHDPAVIGESRSPDHRRRKLGPKWHAVARNTVPIQT